ncbi:Pogo transposable element with KRAB, partial [Stegodyphus mimosarum]
MDFSLRHTISICQKVPAYFKDKLMQFQCHVISLWRRYVYEFKFIRNADEAPVYFHMQQNYTVNSKSEKEAKILNTGYKKQYITVILCVTTDGHKLPPYLILNRKLVP